jgi:quinol monooxygenase YgiN
MHPTARQQALMAVLVIGLLALSGCLTYNPSVTTETTDSTIFENVSVNES